VHLNLSIEGLQMRQILAQCRNCGFMVRLKTPALLRFQGVATKSVLLKPGLPTPSPPPGGYQNAGGGRADTQLTNGGWGGGHRFFPFKNPSRITPSAAHTPETGRDTGLERPEAAMGALRDNKQERVLNCPKKIFRCIIEGPPLRRPGVHDD